MTKAKAIEILSKIFDGYLIMEKVCSAAIGEFDDKQLIRYRLDEITDKKIALLTAIGALEQDNGWISVKDRMPDDEKRYLICGLHGRIDIAYYQPMGDKFSNHEPFWQGSNCRFTVVTHWMPLPAPPKEDNAE